MTSFAALKDGQAGIAVVGLGYVGLPLAVALAEKFRVLGFDIAEKRVTELSGGFDRTGEVEDARLQASGLRFSCSPEDLGEADVIIVAVPTPIDRHRNPDLTPMLTASALVGRYMKKGCVVVYESTVYPGVTEEECVPILARESGLIFGHDFFVGYSPERINPGDKVHTVDRIVKVVSASNGAALDLLASMYGGIVTAGVHRAPSIKVAEAAKVIENTQRDLNIALMNELALIFDRMGIDTLDVLEAAGTKWNFLPFRPGLVGGHCIGVDPYYLTFKAEEMGYHPQVILAGRRINDTMGKFIAEKTVKMLIAKGCLVGAARVGILGLTFKENIPDLRNTRVIDIYQELQEYGCSVLVHDPMADPAEARHEYGIDLCGFAEMRNLDALVVAVGHEPFVGLSPEAVTACFARPEAALVLDVKGIWPQNALEDARVTYWRL